MAVQRYNRSRKKPSGSRVTVVVILLLIAAAVGGYYLFSPQRHSSTTPPSKQNVSPARPGAPEKPLLEHPAVPGAPVLPPPKEQEDSVAPQKTESGKRGTLSGASVRLAIIIDDMGGSLPEAHALAAIHVPLTFAIIPGLRVAPEVAAYAAAQKIETMIHIPMQSKGWPARRLEANGLLVGMEAGELQERVAGFVRQFPGAAGANNHMGSEFTEHGEKMEAVLRILKKNNLFFIDSVTSPDSTGLKVAQQVGIRSARRHVFLDNEQERGYILGQLGQAVAQARKSGSAVAICHPHPATISALAAALPALAGQGVALVPASHLVR